MTIRTDSPLREVAFVVCTALDRAGTTAVLTGGSAATVYAPQAYQSSDLDFVILFWRTSEGAGEILTALGYVLHGSHYVHAKNALTVDFIRDDLAVGGDLIRTWETVREGDYLLHVISPTDSCRDRLAAFFHWNDYGGLEQALAVEKAQRERIDFDLIRKWSKREGAEDKFEEFKRRMRL